MHKIQIKKLKNKYKICTYDNLYLQKIKNK